MKENFQRSVKAVLKYEGGYADNPADPGGATNRGITIATLRAWRGHPVTKADVKALTEAEAVAIYKARYWDPIRGDQLPAGVDHALFDIAVNSGPGRVPQFSKLVTADPAASIRAICGARMAYLRRLSTWRTFGRGWTTRVKRVEKEALSMAGSPLVVTPDPIAERVTVVKRVQTRLVELGLGLIVGRVDGDMGNRTREAVRAFQACRGGLEVDGIVGPKTTAALFP